MAAEFTERRIQSNGTSINVNITDETRKQPYIDVQKNGQTQRIYGTQAQLDQYQNKKPDGTDALRGDAKAGVGIGKALKAAEQLGATINPVTDAIPSAADIISGVAPALKRTKTGTRFPNPLEQFASMTPLWTLICLTPAQFNKPTSYRDDDLSYEAPNFAGDPSIAAMMDTRTSSVNNQVVFSSAGRYDSARVKTKFGAPEYFIDNFEMSAAIAPQPATGVSNAVSFNFTIMEPYSMGLLLQSMQVAAINCGHANYIEAPFLLRLDFNGFNEQGQSIKSIKPKHFIMKFKKVDFEVTESGSQYNVQAYPFNHQGFADTVDMLFTDISIAPKDGDTASVYGVLADPNNPKSLVRLLNDNERDLVKDGKYQVEDQYEIQFPEKSFDFTPKDTTTEDKGATITRNPFETNRTVLGKSNESAAVDAGKNVIAQSGFDFTPAKGGNFAFNNEADVVDEDTGVINRGKISISPKERVFNFTQKMKLTDVIQEIVLASEYSAKAVSGELPQTSEGYVQWFRIDVQIEFLEYDFSIGDFAKKYTFRVVPYKAHASVFSSATSKPPGQAELNKQIVKEYNYIYTGQNNDILDFQIKINNLFYTGINPSSESKTASVSNNDTNGSAENKVVSTETQTGTEKKVLTSNLGKTKTKRDPNLLNNQMSGTGYADVKTMVAKNFHNALISNASADLIKVDLEIIGDTFWLVESGLSNYFSQAADGAQVTLDGTANYEGNDVFIRINFATPIDGPGANGTDPGTYKFGSVRQSPFSGIYRVYKCLSTFEGGIFKQTLSCVRMQGQAEEFEGEVLQEDSGAKGLATGITGEKPPKTNPSEPPAPDLNVLQYFSDLTGIDLSKFATGPAAGPKPAEEPRLIEKRRQSNGAIVDFNIDKTKPFTDSTDAQGNTIRIYES